MDWLTRALSQWHVKSVETHWDVSARRIVHDAMNALMVGRRMAPHFIKISEIEPDAELASILKKYASRLDEQCSAAADDACSRYDELFLSNYVGHDMFSAPAVIEGTIGEIQRKRSPNCDEFVISVKRIRSLSAYFFMTSGNLLSWLEWRLVKDKRGHISRFARWTCSRSGSFLDHLLKARNWLGGLTNPEIAIAFDEIELASLPEARCAHVHEPESRSPLNLSLVVQNLLHNAVAYAAPSSSVRVRGIVKDDGGRFTGLRINNYAIKLLDLGMDFLCEAGYRGPSASILTPGAGLGLFVVSIFVAMNGGRLEITRKQVNGNLWELETTILLPAATDPLVADHAG